MLRLLYRCVLMVLTVLLLEIQFSEAFSKELVKEKRETKQLAGNMGNEFYIGFLDNYIKPLYQNVEALIINGSTIFITTTDPFGAITMIESEQGTSTLNVSPSTTVTNKIRHYKAQSSSDRNKGMKIKAEQSKQISVFAINEELQSVDGFTALPCSQLPSVGIYEYFAVSVPPSTISNIDADSAFLIVACSDNTTLTVTPSQSIDHPDIPDYRVRAGETFSLTLQERETLYIQNREDLTGSKVESSVPISFFTGHECGNVPADIAECDHLVEQIPPTVTWGTRFIIAPTATRTADDLIKVVAAEENTKGQLSCVNQGGVKERSNFTISNAGNYYEFRLSHDKYCFLETNEPVLVIQFTPGRGADGVNGDPFMVIVPAVRQYLENSTFSTANGIGLYFNNYINVFVSAGPNEFDSSTILVDGIPIATDNWIAAPCYDDNSTCGHAATVNITDGIHSVWNEDGESPIGLTVYGLYLRETYAYVGGLKLSLPGLDPDLSPTSYFVLCGSSICMPCQRGNTQQGARFEWSREGIFLLQSQKMRVASDGSLCIDNATFGDAGNYTCYMSGEPYPAQLSVISGIVVEPPNCGPINRGAIVGVGQDTVYLNTSTEALQVCCRVQGPPETKVSWLLNGVLITRGMNDYEFGKDYIHYSGSLKTGCMTFTCQANFSADIPVVSESSEICIGDDSPPTFVSITGRKSILEHSSVSYQCSSDGFPRPRKIWMVDQDMEEILPQTATDYGNGTLTISSVTEMDGNHKYCCYASNEHGQQYNCTRIDVLIPPELVKGVTFSMVNVSIPFGATLPLETPENITTIIGQNVMIPETYNLYIKCMVYRANPKASISWFHDNEPIRGQQYTVQDDGNLVIEDLTRGRDDGMYTCVAYTPNIGRDESSSTVIVTVPPQINTSKLVNSPGNCLDLTHDLENAQQVGLKLCVKAGPSAQLTLRCDITEGIPTPVVKWLKDGNEVLTSGGYNPISLNLTLSLPTNASNAEKEEIEGNYTCVAINVAGVASASSHVTLFGDIPVEVATTEFVMKQSDVYHQLHRTVSEHFPGVQDGDEHLMFLTSGKILSYQDFDPGYLYDGSEESMLPQTMENIFDLVDVVPNGGSIVFNSYEAQRLQETYSKLVEMLQVAPTNLNLTYEIRQYLQETVQDLGSNSNELLPRLSLYLKYKNSYYMTVFEVDDLIESQRQSLHSWEFTQWYEHNIERLNMKKHNEYMKWKMFAGKEEVEEKLSFLKLEDHLQEVNLASALLLASQRKSRFKDEKQYYLVKLYPDTWYKGLKNRVKESIHQMQYQLTQLKTEVQILEITSRYLDKETKKRETLNALFPSFDPILKLYCDLDVATYHLEQIVKESEDMRYRCLVSGNPADCHLYWNLQEYIHDQVLENYTEFYWYVHTVQAALDHRKYSIPAISSTISNLEVKIRHIQASINIALSELADRDKEETNDDRDFLSDFTYKPDPSLTNYSFSLPPSLVGRLLWYINPESTELLPKDVLEEYNLTFNHLNTAFTNVSAKLMTVNIHRRWFKSAIFGNKHLTLKNPDLMVSPGPIKPPQDFRNKLQATRYLLPLYPSSLLLATNIELTLDVPYVFHTLPTLIKLSYDPHISGGFGPFSFGPLYRASAGNMKFRVGIKENKITVTIPGTQMIGYVCDVIPKHPTQMVERSRRSVNNYADTQTAESEFDQWLFSKRNNPSTRGRQFLKDTGGDESQQYSYSTLGGRESNNNDNKEEMKSFEMLIAPSHPLKDMHSHSEMSEQYSFSTNMTTRNRKSH